MRLAVCAMRPSIDYLCDLRVLCGEDLLMDWENGENESAPERVRSYLDQ